MNGIKNNISLFSYSINKTDESNDKSIDVDSLAESILCLFHTLNDLSQCVEQICKSSCLNKNLVVGVEEIYVKMMNLKTRDMSILLNAFIIIENAEWDDCSSTDSPFIPVASDRIIWETKQNYTSSHHFYLSPENVHLMNGSDYVFDDKSPWTVRSDLTSDPFGIARQTGTSGIQDEVLGSPVKGMYQFGDELEEGLQTENNSSFFAANDSMASGYTSGGLFSIKETSIEETESIKSGASEESAPTLTLSTEHLVSERIELPTDEKFQLNVKPMNMYTPEITVCNSFCSLSTNKIKTRNFESEFSLEAKAGIEERLIQRRGNGDVLTDLLLEMENPCDDLRRSSIGSNESRNDSDQREPIKPIDSAASDQDESLKSIDVALKESESQESTYTLKQEPLSMIKKVSDIKLSDELDEIETGVSEPNTSKTELKKTVKLTTE